MQRYVVGFAFNESETLLALLLKARPDWQRGRLNGVGGHVEEEESEYQAMSREWEEETNLPAPLWTLFAVLRGKSFSVHFFRSNVDLSGVECRSPMEHVVLVCPEALPVNVLSNLRWLIPMASVRSKHDWPYAIEESATP